MTVKPTYGRVSRNGIIAHSFSFDHVGPMTRNVEDCALMLNEIAGFDPDDSSCADEPVPDYAAELSWGVRGFRIGLIRHLYEEYLSVDVDTLATMNADFEVLKNLGAHIDEVRIRPLSEYSECRNIIVKSEDYAIHEQEFLGRLNDYGVLMRNRNPASALIPAVDYIQAQRMRLKLASEFAEILNKYEA